MLETALRYVVLHHTGFGDPHYDLMIESALRASLMTWRLTDWPPAAGDTLTRIGEHRRAYLDYEGPVSNNRGHVRRVASGNCECSINESQITIQFREPTRMLVLLRQIQNGLWNVVEVDD
jgi:hypothetical protein